MGSMRGFGRGVFAVSFCAVLILGASAQAQTGGDWVARAHAIAREIADNDMIVTDRVRAERQQTVARMGGETKLQALYDLAADDYVASDSVRGAASIAALEVEARIQRNARFQQMAHMLRAYAPALNGDYVAARRDLAQALSGATDPYVRAAGERLLAYALTDLGQVGSALEAARSGLLRLPDDPTTLSLRSGLHDAMSYNAIKIGDYDAAINHLQRTVELDTTAGRPVDGQTIVHNIVSMLALGGAEDAALRLLPLYTQMAQRSGSPADRFFAELLCAKVNFAAYNFERALSCANAGRAIAEAPPEYMPRLLTFRLHALARLGHGREARRALDQLRAIAQSRGDPGLTDRLNQIEPEVLAAEGRLGDAFMAMRLEFEHSQQTAMTRFNDGVKEMRATLESEVTQAEERAEAQAIRAELQARTLEKMTLAFLLGSACFIGVAGVALLIYRSRRDMIRAVARAEEVLVGRGADLERTPVRQTPAVSQRERLANILDEIERRDVELKCAFAQLDAARAAAEAANVAKSQFLATMSHELRTPLNAIIGYSELLMEVGEENSADETCQRDLDRIRGAGHRLLMMINDVLDLSKIEAGAMSANVGAVDLDALMHEIVDTVTPQAVANGNRVETRACDLGYAETDGFKLSQCLLNLMSNAAKFTSDGLVTLSARREQRSDGEWLAFTVSDTGIGISAEAQQRLFRPFVQADATTTRAYGGTGLGLAITRSLAQMLGGDVSVQSKLGEGATFTLHIPAILPDGESHEAETNSLVAA